MKALLLTLIFTAAINTALAIWNGLTGNLGEITPAMRAINALWTAFIGAWALWLYAKGGAA